jgi:galactokinase
MTGAGFGGCAVALVHKVEVETFAESTLDRYFAATDNAGAVYVSAAVAGAELIRL